MDFEQKKKRHYCRYPRCRMKLPEPVTNEREGFCCRGCYDSFYLKRCRICEKALGEKYRKLKPKKDGDPTKFVKVQNSGPTCGEVSCKTTWRSKDGLGRFAAPKPPSGYQGSQNADLHQETPISCGSNSDVQKPGHLPRWRIVAGPPLTPNQFHCATVPDGPDCKWEGGSYERLEAQNRRMLEKHFDQLDAEAVANDFCAACGRTDNLSVTLCYGCLDKRSRPTPVPISGQQHRIPDDLSIPPFLDRHPQELRAAA
jgi:hypothetical protein